MIEIVVFEFGGTLEFYKDGFHLPDESVGYEVRYYDDYWGKWYGLTVEDEKHRLDHIFSNVGANVIVYGLSEERFYRKIEGMKQWSRQDLLDFARMT